MTIAMTARDSIGRRLRASRALAGMDQQQIADSVGVSRTTVSGWERGQFEPTFSQLVRWAHVSGQGLEWFAQDLDPEEMCARRDSNSQPSDLESEREFWKIVGRMPSFAYSRLPVSPTNLTNRSQP